MAMFFKILSLIVKYGPTIWSLVGEIIDLINGVASYLEKQDAIEFKKSKKIDLDSAVNYYKLTKDKEKLNALHGELSVQLANFNTGAVHDC